MAIWYYAQIEWLGEPSREQVKEANRRLREIDYDAPKLNAQGYDGSWREPVGGLSKSEQIAEVVDVVFPCRVRIGAPDYGCCDLRERTAKDVCEASAWIYSRPLFKEGVATRAGAMRLMHDDGTMGEPVQVREGDRLSDIIAKIGQGR